MKKESDRIVITSMGHFHPPHSLDSSFFDELDIGSSRNWIIERTGIQSRSSVLSAEDIIKLKSGETSLTQLRRTGKIMSIGSMSKPAWELLSQRHPNPALEKDIDLLLCGTSVPDFDIPANACCIAAEIGANCPAFDINSACSSFVVNLHAARGMLSSDQHQKAAIFNPERYSIRLDYSDRGSCILFGDGCSSALLEKGDECSGLQLLDTIVVSDPSNFNVVAMPDGELFYQDGKAVQKFAISRTIDATRTILERNHLRTSDIAYFIGHQANLRMLESSANRLDLPPERHLFNVNLFGNQGAAGAPAVLSMHWDKFQLGDIVVITVVGSGLTWGSALFRKV